MKYSTIILYGEGLCSTDYSATPSLLEQSKHEEIDKIALNGNTTLLHLRSQESENEDEISISEFAQLLGVQDKLKNNSEAPSLIQQLYSNMKLKVLSNSKSIVSFLHDKVSHSDAHLSDFSLHSEEGIEQVAKQTAVDAIQATPAVDGVLIHIRSSSAAEKKNAVHLIDSILKHISSSPDLNRLYIVVAMNFGKVTKEALEQEKKHEEAKTKLVASLPFIPNQSFSQLAGAKLSNVRKEFPVLAAYYNHVISRRDKNTKFTEKSCLENSGMGSVLADRFLFEISYRIGLTPKYGA